MRKYLLTAVFTLMATTAFAEEVQQVPPEVATGETRVVKVPNAIEFETKSFSSPLDNGSGGWKEYIAVDSPQELVSLQKKYGGMLYVSTGELCDSKTNTFGGTFWYFNLSYGLIGSKIGDESVKFYSYLDLTDLVKASVADQKDGFKSIESCTLVGTDTVTIKLRAPNT